MKYMIISDMHGSYEWTQKALQQFKTLNADFLISLGDVLYHGPRNALPFGHDPCHASNILNEVSGKVIAVRGNCDAEVDQVMLNFPCMADYTTIVDEGRMMFLTHGHLFDEDCLPFKLSKGDIYLSGHTHVWRIEEKNGVIFCNPGSVSLPKGNSPVHSFALYENGNLSVVSLEDASVLKHVRL